MPRKKLPRQEEAYFRYLQIESALDAELSPERRAALLRTRSQTAICWPSGAIKPPSLASLYRWLAAYQRDGLAGLESKPRCDTGTRRAPLPRHVVDKALEHLAIDPGASLTFLMAYLSALYPDVPIRRSTLQRHLAANPLYVRVKRRYRKGRIRYVAKAPHDIWHTDAKGPVTVETDSGPLSFRVISIIDDHSRDVLAALVVVSEDTQSAIRVFRRAASSYGLPEKLYADRGSAYDSKAFRRGIAILGSCRIKTKPKNPQPNGKIEAYHRVLSLWFFKRLHTQKIIDLAHLQQLLDGVLQSMYRTHVHRGLKRSPKDALAGRLSPRQVPPSRLFEAFRAERMLKAHPVTGEVDISGTTYLVPEHLRGKRLAFWIDPSAELEPVVVDPVSEKQLALKRAAIAEAGDDPFPTRWAEGPLQAIYDSWQGKVRPVSEPGFGLPELYALLAKACGRHVPASEAEADLIMRVYRDIGPLPKVATEKAMARIARQLGSQRPLIIYIEALCERIRATETDQTRRAP